MASEKRTHAGQHRELSAAVLPINPGRCRAGVCYSPNVTCRELASDNRR